MTRTYGCPCTDILVFFYRLHVFIPCYPLVNIRTMHPYQDPSLSGPDTSIGWYTLHSIQLEKIVPDSMMFVYPA